MQLSSFGRACECPSPILGQSKRSVRVSIACREVNRRTLTVVGIGGGSHAAAATPPPTPQRPHSGCRSQALAHRYGWGGDWRRDRREERETECWETSQGPPYKKHCPSTKTTPPFSRVAAEMKATSRKQDSDTKLSQDMWRAWCGRGRQCSRFTPSPGLPSLPWLWRAEMLHEQRLAPT